MKIRADSFDITTKEMAQLIDDYVFSERDRAILKRRLCDSIPYEQLAEEFYLSTQQVKAIVYKHFQRLITKIK